MIGKFVVCKSGKTGKPDYWNGTAAGVTAWSSSPMGAKLFDSEESAMKAFCGDKRFTGKVTRSFADASAPACREQATIEVVIIQILPQTTKRFTISAGKNFP